MKVKRKKLCLSISQDILQFIDNQPASRSQIIERSIKSVYKLYPKDFYSLSFNLEKHQRETLSKVPFYKNKKTMAIVCLPPEILFFLRNQDKPANRVIEYALRQELEDELN